MSKQSGFLLKQAELRQLYIDASERITQQMMVDTLQITLHQFGWGYERIKRLTDAWAAEYNHYHDALSKDPEADVLREHLDRQLSEILRGHMDLIPFEARYPEARKITYEKKSRK